MQQELKLCRICAKSHTTMCSHKLFERSRRALLRKISQLTGVTLKNDRNLPQLMCVDCELELERAYQFRERCISAQTYFSSLEYRNEFNHEMKHKTNKILKRLGKVSSDVNVQTLSNEKEYEATNVGFDIFLKNEPNSTSELKSEFTSITETEVLHVICDDTAPILGQSTEQLAPKRARRDKPKRLAESVLLEHPIDESEKLYRTIPKLHDVLKSEPEEGSQDEDTLVTKTKRERKNSGKRTYICDQCGNHFKCRSHFYAHIKRHSGIKPLQCEVCPNKFFTEGELKRHMRRHTGERPFACQHCQRRFTDYSTRIKHERTHTNERPFACAQCGKAFTTSYILKNHMLVHTGERSFRCTLCNKSFQRQTHLIVHNRSLSHKHNLEREQQSYEKQTGERMDSFSPRYAPLDM